MGARTGTRAAATLPVIALLVTSSSCGFILTQAPPQNHEQLSYFSCTESNVGPILDVIWAGLNVLGALTVSGDPNSYNNPGQVEAVGLGWGVLSGAAAVAGFGKTSRCRAAKSQLAERQARGLTGIPTADSDSSVVAVTVAPAVDTLRVGASVQLVAGAHGSSGRSIPNSAFSWSSSNDAVASVNAAGQVTANAVGSIVVAARTGSVVGTATVVVLAAH
jgi:Big-like domain-containing protein